MRTTLTLFALSLSLSGCAGLQSSIDQINAKLQSTDFSGAKKQKKGTITMQQCKTSVGKSRASFEKILGFPLNDRNASSYTSFGSTYNLEVGDVKGKLGMYPVCIISVNSKGIVSQFSIVN